MIDHENILKIRDFGSLIDFLIDDLNWPIDIEAFDDLDKLAFEYQPEEIGLTDKFTAKVNSIKQLRPLISNQPWAIFYIEFEPHRLPITVLRRILNFFVNKKRASVSPNQTWEAENILFITAHGEDNLRGMTFAHFRRDNGKSELREFMWNQQETEFPYISQYLEKLEWPESPDNVTNWERQWQSAFIGSKRKSFSDSKDLAKVMADFAREIRTRVSEVVELFRSDQEPFQKLIKTFKRELIHDLDADSFADMFAQTITYGLFTARASFPEKSFILEEAVEWIPDTNPFLKNLFKQCFGLTAEEDTRIDLEEVGINLLVELFEEIKADRMQRILNEFGSQTGDPVIHFYEGFLDAYESEQRKRRGVYYTPDPVVSFIVRSVHKILKDEFNLPLGLADTTTWGQMVEKHNIDLPKSAKKTDPFVQILDPACGTGTFIKHTIKVIHETMLDYWKRQSVTSKEAIKANWNEYVNEHLLTRLYGFELMPAPYAVCHMKIGMYLKDTGYEFMGDQRLHVYLVNTLSEPEYTIPMADVSFLATEINTASIIKQHNPITVMIGNPPYAGHSANTNWVDSKKKKRTWIGKLIQTYFYEDDDMQMKLKERNPKWLNDDYVKFIRFAQWRLDETGIGILGYITNHGYLDNPTFRAMRRRLMKSFNRIALVDLHGSTKKKEKHPDGSKDENVFDIEPGVAIGLMRKTQIGGINTSVSHANNWGLRAEKYDTG